MSHRPASKRGTIRRCSRSQQGSVDRVWEILDTVVLEVQAGLVVWPSVTGRDFIYYSDRG